MANIAFDVDDVIFPFASNMLAFYNQFSGMNYTLDDYTNYHLWEVLGCSQEESKEWVKQFAVSDYCRNLPPIEGSIETINKLSCKHTLYIITARWTEQEYTKEYLAKHCPCISSERIYFTAKPGMYSDKVCKSEVCLYLGIDVIIDDRDKNILDCAEKGINSILFQPPEYRWNEPIACYPNIIRVGGWHEVESAIELLLADEQVLSRS